ncbi:MAG: class I SAM-dependent methyltransferase [Saprospiraceae bacterium]
MERNTPNEIVEIYAITPDRLIQKKLELLELKKGEILYDLGSGDGQCLIQACQEYNTNGIGYELLPHAIELSKKNIEKAGFLDKIEIRKESFMNIQFKEMTALILYLNRNVLGKLSLKLETELPIGARIVTHDFDLPAWEPRKVVDFTINGLITKIYLYQR